MKIGILTLNGYFNYGNRLQNYAVENIVNILGYKAETIINTTNTNKSKSLSNKLETFVKLSTEKKINNLWCKINKKKIDNLISERTRKFKYFSNVYLNETDFTIDVKNINKFEAINYEYFLTGSDQVWNPNDETVSQINFLTFAPKEKRIAYAPSFGVSQIQNKDKEHYKKWLSGIDKISVREDDGAKIIKKLIGKDVPVVLDPTMLLSKEDWLLVSKSDEAKPKKDYILTYFLGEIPKEYKKKIKELSKKNDLEIVNLANINYPKYYVNGPSEFIDYINSAKVFFTDSFHGCVFSLLMETPFVVCDRKGQSETEKMSSRIDTFTRKFKLENRKFKNINFDDVFVCDYKESKKILDIEKAKSFEFLKDALSVKINENSTKGEKIEI